MDIRVNEDILAGLTIASLILCLVVALYDKIRENREKESLCLQKHHGAAHVVETEFAVTAAGCTISKVEKFDGLCLTNGYVYLADCSGSVSWNERHGTLPKSSTTP